MTGSALPAPITLGFIGCGTLTDAVVRGIRTHGREQPGILLSPRSESVSRALAERFANIERASSNAEVAASADIVILAVRPQQIDEALAGLAFRPDQIVLSFLAKVSCEALRERIGDGPRIARMTPLPSIELGKGPIIVYPRLDEAIRLLDGLGDVIVARSEHEIMALGYASGLLSTYFEVQNTTIDWLGRNGASAEHASLYVRSMLEGLAATGKETAAEAVAALPGRHETHAGLNERSRSRLRALGWFDEIGRTLDLLDRKTTLAPERGTRGQGGK